MEIDLILILFSSISFIFYSLRSFFSSYMLIEFKRWGLSNLRVVISFLQLFGSIGLLFGLVYNQILVISSFFFVIMMIVALYYRFKVKDGIVASLPAIVYIIINVIIFTNSLTF